MSFALGPASSPWKCVAQSDRLRLQRATAAGAGAREVEKEEKELRKRCDRDDNANNGSFVHKYLMTSFRECDSIKSTAHISETIRHFDDENRQ